MPIKELVIVGLLMAAGSGVSRYWCSFVPPSMVMRAAHCLDFITEVYSVDDLTITVSMDEIEEVKLGMSQQLSQQ